MQAKPGFNARCTLDTREEDAITDYNFGTRFGLYDTEKRSSFVEGVLSDRASQPLILQVCASITRRSRRLALPRVTHFASTPSFQKLQF